MPVGWTERNENIVEAYLSRLKRQVCETLENPPLVVAVPTVRFRTAAAGRSRDSVAAAVVRDEPHADQNLATNFRPRLALRTTPLPPPPDGSAGTMLLP